MPTEVVPFEFVSHIISNKFVSLVLIVVSDINPHSRSTSSMPYNYSIASNGPNVFYGNELLILFHGH